MHKKYNIIKIVNRKLYKKYTKTKQTPFKLLSLALDFIKTERSKDHEKQYASIASKATQKGF